jgi:hypothetical protein
MDELTLARYRDKNPAVRETTEAARVKGKVDKADKKRRKRMHPNDPRLLRLAEMDREIAVGRKEQAVSEVRDNPERLRLAQELERKAERHMAEHGTVFVEAVRAVSRESESNEAEPGVGDVERHMKEHGIEDFGIGLRSFVQSEQITEQTSRMEGSRLSDADYDSQLRSRMKELGYEVSD